VAVEATFGTLDARLTAMRESFTDLRVVLQEDSPQRGAPLLVDQLGDAATDLLGWLEEAAEAGAEALRQAARPRDLDAVQAALLTCHERLHQVAQRFASDLLSCERAAEIHDLGRERGRAWSLWSASVERALGHCQAGLLAAGGAVLDGWKEITDLRIAPQREPAARIRRAG